jgi:hypothetical protein
MCAVGWNVGRGLPINLQLGSGAPSQRRLFEVEDMTPYDFRMNRTYADISHYFSDDWTHTAWTNKFMSLPSTQGGVTACFDDTDCVHSAAVCSGPTPFQGNGTLGCASCPMRNFFLNESGHACKNSRCACTEPAPDTSPAIDYTQIAWYGGSKCAVVGRTYNQARRLGGNVTALEYLELQSCAHSHYAGVVIGKVLNMPSLQPAFMYDRLIALRAVLHIGAGSLLYLLVSNSTDEALWHAMNALQIDPALVLPVVRHAATVSNLTVEAFPRMVNLTSRTLKWGVKVSELLVNVPTPTALWDSTKYLMNTTVLIATESGALNKTRQSIQNAVGAAEFKTLDELMRMNATTYSQRVHSAWGYVESGRRLLMLPRITGATCPVVTTLVNDLVRSANTAVTHYKYNVPRAACHLIEASNDRRENNCPRASWDQSDAAQATPSSSGGGSRPPPPRPSPPPTTSTRYAYPPPAAAAKIVDAAELQDGSAIQNLLLGLFSGLINVDIGQQLETQLSWFIRNGEKVVEDAAAGASWFECDYDESVMCLKRSKTHTLQSALLTTVFYYAVAVSVLSFIGLGLLRMPISVLFALLVIPITFKKAYNMPIGCVVSVSPVIPVCLGEDVRTIALDLLPRHLPWPGPLVDTHNRLTVSQTDVVGTRTEMHFLSKSDVVDCSALGFVDGTRVLIYGLDYLEPGWRAYLTGTSTSVLFGIRASDTFDFFKDAEIHGAVYKQCALVNAITVVPLLMLAILLIVFGVAAVHCLLLFVRNILLGVRELFLALSYAYMEARDG